MRMIKLPYTMVESVPFKAPKGKLPYIKDNNIEIADSRFITAYLNETYGNQLDNDLNTEQRAVALAIQRMIEEHLFWATMYTRWQYTEENWLINKQAIFGGLPPIIKDIAALTYRHLIKKQIYGHGIGRHQPEEIFQLAQLDLHALSKYLANKTYFMGAHPTTLDATAYGFLVNTLGCPIESPLKDYALTHSNLLAYCQRMHTEFYPELPALKP